ncbi:MAG: hypothetical protein JNL67_01535 [Planctomycetaceae bacterium]|nr:hypothetical protein [Planctomycetaceae bacterium]
MNSMYRVGGNEIQTTLVFGKNLSKLGVAIWCVGALLCLLGCGGADQAKTPDKETAAVPVAKPTSTENVEIGLPWSYRPYEVKVWMIVDEQPRWNRSFMEQLCGETSTQLRLTESAAWRVSTEVVPQKWRDLFSNWNHSISELPVELYDELYKTDKLFVVRLADTGTGFDYAINELDISGWSLGPVYSKSVSETGYLAGCLADTIAKAFRPVVQLEHSDADIVTARVRAHGLMVRVEETVGDDQAVVLSLVPNTTSPCWIQSGEVFEPIVRQSNRQRKFELKDIETLEFTLLVQQDAVEGPYVKAKVVSVNRAEAALGRKKGRNTEKIGIVVRTPAGPSQIRLFTKRGTTKENLAEFPLNGYQVYSRSIFGTEESFEYLGKTNWNGQIEIKPGDERVRLLLVKNGERNIARLPIVPGYKPFMEKLLPDDEDRILAEGVVAGLKSETLDLWARRQVLAERIKLALGKNEFSMANRYYEMYRQLVTINQWNDMLSATQERLASKEKRQQTKITAMFKELSDFSQKEFKPDHDAKVQEMMLEARQQRVGEQ